MKKTEPQILDKIRDDPEFKEFLWAIGTAFESGVCGQELWEAVQEFVEKEWGITLYDAIEVMKDVDWRAEEWLKNLPRCCPNMEINEDGVCNRCGRSVEEVPGLKEQLERGPLA